MASLVSTLQDHSKSGQFPVWLGNRRKDAGRDGEATRRNDMLIRIWLPR